MTWTIRDAEADTIEVEDNKVWEILDEATQKPIAIVYDYENARIMAASKELLPEVEKAYNHMKDIPDEPVKRDKTEEDDLKIERNVRKKRKVQDVRNIIDKANA